MKNVSVCIIIINTILHICSGTLENFSQTFFKFQLHVVWTCQICNATNARESSAFLLVMWQISFDLIINEKKHNYLKHCDLTFCTSFDSHLYISCRRVQTPSVPRNDRSLKLSFVEIIKSYLFSIPKTNVSDNSWRTRLTNLHDKSLLENV